VNEPSTLPALASVVFARITEFVRRPVAEQARLRAQLEAALAVSLLGCSPDIRIVLDAPDGVAVAVLGNPGAALNIAQRCMSVAAAGVPLAIAVNHGAIRLAPDAAGHQGLIGDAIGTAAAIAHFAGAARLFVSRSFRDALAESAPARAAGLRPAGVFTDANVRTHELLAPDPAAAIRRRKILAAVGAAAMIALVAAAAATRDGIRRAVFADQPTAVAFDIRPDGDVFVDGVLRGKSPPVSELRLEPGLHTIEVRRKGYSPFRVNVDLEAGRSATVRHAFTPADERGLLRRLRDAVTR